MPEELTCHRTNCSYAGFVHAWSDGVFALGHIVPLVDQFMLLSKLTFKTY
jgi:hypothetical protein